MAVVSVVKLSGLEGAKRIDADYYRPELDLMKKSLKKIGEPLKNLISYIRHPAEIKRIYEDAGIPYILAENISKYFWILQFTEERYISEEKARLIPQNKLKIGDVLVTRTGANYGDTCVYLGNPNPAYASAHIIIIRPHKIAGEYLAAFFNTHFGKKLIKRGWYGSSQPEISPTYLMTLPIPRLGDLEEEVKNLVRKAYEFYRYSKILYHQAESLLLKELGLKVFKPKYELSYTANLSQTFNVHRIDAEHFQPIYRQLGEYLRNKFETKTLAQLGYRTINKIQPQKGLYKYVEISDIKTDIGEVGYTERYYEELPPNARIPIFGGELLVSKVRPTRKAIALVPENIGNNVICSSAFSVFNLPDIVREYVFVVLRSIVGLLQLEQPQTGTEYPTITDRDIESIIIPILSKKIQQKIAELVKQSHEARRKAKELLEEAKRKVEEAIESKLKDKTSKSDNT